MKRSNSELLSVLILAVILLSGVSVGAQPEYDNVYVFGDSASDTGNLASILNFTLPDPPFFESSRISNGQVAVEIMAGKLQREVKPSLYLKGTEQGTNYAVAGGRAAATETDTRGLTTQIATFINNQGGSISRNSLYVMYIGANDIRDALAMPTGTQRQTHIKKALDNVKQSLKQLKEAGGRHFLVVNSPNIARAPELIEIATKSSNPSILSLARDLSENYNRHLKLIVNQLRKSKRSDQVHVVWFDLFALVEFIIDNGELLGFLKVDEACYDSTMFQFLPGCENGKNFTKYVFFDGLHFTAVIHKIMGKSMVKSLRKHYYSL